MTLSKKDLETGLKKYEQAIIDAENDKEFAEMIVEALKNKIINTKEMEENGE